MDELDEKERAIMAELGRNIRALIAKEHWEIVGMISPVSVEEEDVIGLALECLQREEEEN